MNQSYQEHLDRIRAAINFEDVDRVPFLPCASSANAALMGVSLADYCRDMELNTKTNLEGYLAIGEPDGVQTACFNPGVLPLTWAGKVKIPGRDLSDNELWQMDEQEIIKEDDYDAILEMGFDEWFQKLLVERLDDPVAYLASTGFFEMAPKAEKMFADAGLPDFAGSSLAGPIEMFCGGRTLMNFMGDDLYEIPEKVEQVFDLVQESRMPGWEAMFKDPKTRPVGVWVGGWRGTPDLLNPEMFERYAWKYMRQIAELCIDYGVVPLFHLDSNWDNGIKYFKELPRHTCILALDGMTDIFKAREVIGDHQCLMGDVPASMTSFAKPEEVEAYCKRLIEEVGPRGYIMATGCDAPFNAKRENLEVMAESVKKFGPGAAEHTA